MRFAYIRSAVAALSLLSAQASAQEQPLTTRCESAPLMAAFTVFSETGRMPPNMAKFVGDAALNKIEPYKAFDNVYYVGICWVSAWLITSPNGHVLIDTLYGPYTSQLLENIRTLGFEPKDIKLVVVTLGHVDHAGGIGQLKSELAPGTRFAMTKEGWREGAEESPHPRWPWIMIEPDIVLTDGQTVTGGDIAVQAFETPGHTMGTASFAFDARDGARTYRAFTVGGLGLNRIRGPEQVEAFIASVKRIRTLTQDGTRPVELHLTTHGFSTGLTEAKDLLKTRKPTDPHPLVDLPGFRKQLDDLQAGAEKRLVVERQKEAK
ncbi:MBL fold metallo-hydrolase [Bradyrhizobium huanghuaihaiense]|uniref:MBL fold metallo-hydrolase n=1 Tax=Bradyrhizobium huanghuaihaiense TaxID=990078 RepID=UPI0021A9FFA7|nr:MBL fold metallo-hydrolase [Bradyrhizobium sp. CB3035]UWU79106.1 MBL fold metallo-hydrolase [Bradyrhizobium sp. CB3035]